VKVMKVVNVMKAGKEEAEVVTAEGHFG
jgi:hypothetical protein